MPTDSISDSPSPPARPATFSDLGLRQSLVHATLQVGFGAPTPVQAAVLPAVLQGRDVWASAQTGSGKTAAFALPLLQASMERPNERPRPIRALILAPTRELVMQIGDVFRDLSRHASAQTLTRVVFGGVSTNPQMMALRGGADIVVATPGRLLDLIGKNALHLRAVRTLVLDEADRLLDGGFGEELERVLDLLPDVRQTLLFSATFPPAIRRLAEAVLRDPLRIDIPVSPESEPDIEERAIEVDRPRRTHLVRHLVDASSGGRALIFVATSYSTEHVAEKLRALGVSAAALHGQLSQGARTRVLTAFREGTTRVLVATDIAARGLDIQDLPLVVNYDLPRSAADYVHRIGRTGRAGERGVAISLVTADTDAHFRLLEKRNRTTIARERVTGFEPKEDSSSTSVSRAERSPSPVQTGGIKGKRKSKKDKLREAAAARARFVPDE
jgi:ATP-dependent RNA helicase RhlE